MRIRTLHFNLAVPFTLVGVCACNAILGIDPPTPGLGSNGVEGGASNEDGGAASSSSSGGAASSSSGGAQNDAAGSSGGVPPDGAAAPCTPGTTMICDSFEEGDLTGWTVSEVPSGRAVAAVGWASAGTHAAHLFTEVAGSTSSRAVMARTLTGPASRITCSFWLNLVEAKVPYTLLRIRVSNGSANDIIALETNGLRSGSQSIGITLGGSPPFVTQVGVLVDLSEHKASLTSGGAQRGGIPISPSIASSTDTEIRFGFDQGDVIEPFDFRVDEVDCRAQ